MSEINVQDISVFKDGTWRSFKTSKIYKDGAWRDFQGIFYNANWYKITESSAPWFTSLQQQQPFGNGNYIIKQYGSYVEAKNNLNSSSGRYLLLISTTIIASRPIASYHIISRHPQIELEYFEDTPSPQFAIRLNLSEPVSWGIEYSIQFGFSFGDGRNGQLKIIL